MLLSYVSLAATIVAILSGFAAVHHGRAMIHEGVSMDEGGGYTVLLVLESMACFVAAAVAIST